MRSHWLVLNTMDAQSDIGVTFAVVAPSSIHLHSYDLLPAVL